MTLTRTRKISSKESRSRRAKGYHLEYECVQTFKNAGAFAMRVPTALQKGELRSIDVIVCRHVEFIQCKYKKKYLKQPEIERIKITANKYQASALLCYRDRGLHFERIE